MANTPIVLAPNPVTAYHTRVFPVELLLLVFEAFINDDVQCLADVRALSCDHPLIPYPESSHAERRGIAEGVCKHWKQVLQTGSVLWSRVDISPEVRIDAIPRVLNLSHTRRLHINLSFLTELTSHAGRSRLRAMATPPLDPVIQRHANHVTQAMHALQSARNRIESLSVYSAHKEILEAFITGLQECSYTLPGGTLEVVYTGPPLSPTDTRSLILPPSPASSTSGLRRLVLQGCAVDWFAMQSILTPSLRDLTLDMIVTPISGEHLSNLLTRCTSLQCLRVAGIFFTLPGPLRADGLDPDSIALTHLPTLHTLSLSLLDLPHAIFLCHSLQLPNLAVLQLDLRWRRPDDYTFLLAAITRPDAVGISLTKVPTISLRTLGMFDYTSIPIFTSLFDELHQVRELLLDFRYLHIDYWGVFITTARRGLMNSLGRLVVAGISATDVQEYICARAAAGLAAIDVVIVAKPADPEVLQPTKWLGWLRKNTSTCQVVSDTFDSRI
ncbi:hypothetical protein C8Q76DRAFT_803437 [Earliella scabrosa]|nr:hypothetical protein C8Q76DRAFT_803437 [Earliella scabrosa]